MATADINSEGRAILGVGAGRHKEEAIAYGVKWGSHRERMERILEGLEIILSLWLNEKTTFKGKYYRVLEASYGRNHCRNLILKYGSAAPQMP